MIWSIVNYKKAFSQSVISLKDSKMWEKRQRIEQKTVRGHVILLRQSNLVANWFQLNAQAHTQSIKNSKSHRVCHENTHISIQCNWINPQISASSLVYHTTRPKYQRCKKIAKIRGTFLVDFSHIKTHMICVSASLSEVRLIYQDESLPVNFANTASFHILWLIVQERLNQII